MDPGFCRAAMTQFYFNKESGQCEKFTYGTCGGNANRFATRESCQKTCG